MASTGSSGPNSHGVAGVCSAVLCLALLNGANADKLYRWVDEEGNVHFTDRMPAEATKQEHSVMDESGNVIEEKETLEAERAKREERELEQAEAERKAEAERRAREEQRRRDRIITQTFTAERDIHLTRENRIEAIEVQIRSLDHGIERLQNKRAQEVQRLSNFDSDSVAADSVRERIDNIDARLDQRLDQRRSLVDQREQVEEKFAHYLERFRELNRAE
ncbi:MAG: DUF4124 domain-containing protein [Halofilum sp. (in: g-proteobacteria)]|nr:DUF4124 domain-containing protein [Halofilum sp. (in: g-proteobacteria)]